MVDTNSPSTVADFVTQAKQLIKSSHLQDAMKLAASQFEVIMQGSGSGIQLRDEVTLLHWWSKIYIAAYDFKTMTGACLEKVTAAIERIENSAEGTFKQADGETAMSQIQIDECKAELLYVKRCIDTSANFYDSDDALKKIEAL